MTAIKARIPAVDRTAPPGDYQAARDSFAWSQVAAEFDWPTADGVNIIHPALDRWADDPQTADRTGLVFVQGDRVDKFSFGRLKTESCRWANYLAEHGFTSGDRLFIFLPPCPEIYILILACARLGVIFSPLAAGLTYDDLAFRLNNARPKGMVTVPDLAERLPWDSDTSLEQVFFLGPNGLGIDDREVIVGPEAGRMADCRAPAWLKPEDPLYLLYTSGSTGPPKGIVHAHGDMVGHLATARWVLNLTPESVLWTDADPAWVTGTVYAVFAPWLCGACSVVQGAPFSASTWYLTLEHQAVTTWYTTPRTIRRLRAGGDDLPRRYNLEHLQHIATVGASLPPELFYWVKSTLDRVPHDTWWMTETGMICLANFRSADTKPGSIGRPVPGVEAAVINDQGTSLPPLSLGQLALRPGWPAMLVDTWGDRSGYQDYFRQEGWFLTGDMATQDEEGYFYHQGRVDDLIKVGETFLGPFEIEQIITQHPAVAEAATIAVHSAGEAARIKAYVTLMPGQTSSRRLALEIKAFVKANLSAEVPLSEIAFLEQLPKTATGKLLRRVLRAMELDLPVGDLNQLKD